MQIIPAVVWMTDNSKANIYTLPSYDCDEYWSIPNWTRVYIRCLDMTWAMVKIGQFTGYIKREQLLFGGDIGEDHSGTM